MDTQTVAATLPGDVIYVSGTVNGVEYTWTNTEGNRWEAIVARTESEIYVVALELISVMGTTTNANFTLYFGTLNLITDRTARDVERWRYLHSKGWAAMTDEEKAEWRTALKGAYNYTDMNRVESAVEYISHNLTEAGYFIDPEVKTVWTVKDHPTKADMERYFANVELLRSILPMYPTTPKTPTTKKKLDYLVANDVEQILSDVDRRINGIKQSWYYAGDVFSGEI
jgi:hypothetical protein